MPPCLNVVYLFISSYVCIDLSVNNKVLFCSVLICKPQGPVVQSIVSLTSSLVVKMLTVLVSTISNSQVFVLKNVSSFCKCKSYSNFFSKNISVYAIFNDKSFNDTLTNNIVSFEQFGPELQIRRLPGNFLFSLFLCKSICCRYSLEVPLLSFSEDIR